MFAVINIWTFTGKTDSRRPKIKAIGEWKFYCWGLSESNWRLHSGFENVSLWELNFRFKIMGTYEMICGLEWAKCRYFVLENTEGERSRCKVFDNLFLLLCFRAPYNHFLYSNRATCYSVTKRHEFARADAFRTYIIEPTWHKGYSRWAESLFQLGEEVTSLWVLQEGRLRFIVFHDYQNPEMPD